MKGRDRDVVPMDWEVFEVTFLNRFFIYEMRETKIEKVINIK